MESRYEILRAIEQNRVTCAGAVCRLRQAYVDDEVTRRRKIKRVWVTAMRAHYRLIDQYLMLNDSISDAGKTQAEHRRGDVQANELWAPPRPAEVPSSSRPNFVADIEVHRHDVA